MTRPLTIEGAQTLSTSDLAKVEAAVAKHATQTAKLVSDLDGLIAAATRMRNHVAARKPYAPIYSWHGYALVNAMHDVTGCDELYALRTEILFDLGVGNDGEPLLHLSDREVRS